MSNFTPHLSLEPDQMATVPETSALSRQEVLTATALALEQAEQLSEPEHQQMRALADQLDLHDSLSIARYGEALQHKLANFSNQALKDALERDTSKVGDLLQDTTRQIQALSSPDSAGTRRGFFRIFKQSGSSSTPHREIVRSLARNKRELDGWRMKLLVDLKLLNQMYEQLLGHYRSLIIHLRAGEQKLARVREDELKPLLQLASARSATEEQILCYSNLETKCRNFAERLQNLAITKTLSLQTASQIQLVASADQQLATAILAAVNDIQQTQS